MQKLGHADRAPAVSLGPTSKSSRPSHFAGGCGSSGSSRLDNMPVTGNTGGVTQGTTKVVVAGEAAGRQEVIRLAGSAKCEVYVYYEGPLGAHLKPEV